MVSFRRKTWSIFTGINTGGCYQDTCNYYIINNSIIVDTSGSEGIWTSLGGNYTINNNIILYAGGKYLPPYEGVSFGWVKIARMSNNIISGFDDDIYTDLIDTLYLTNNIIIGRINCSGILSAGDNIVARNNIFTHADEGIKGDSRVKSDYNLFWENNTNLLGLSHGDSDKVADPMFVKDKIPDSTMDFDFHLQTFSPGIDKGDPSILDKDGSRSDIGLGGPLGEIYIYQDLAPRAPVNLTGEYSPDILKIKWNKNSEADTGYYSIYMDTTENFQIDSTKLIVKQSDNIYLLSGIIKNKNYYFKVTATDKQRNQSLPSEELHVIITGIDENYPKEITDYQLYQNYPNPFNPSTKIGYRLKDREYVKLMVYDLKGELIKVLVNKEQEAGYYEEQFNANGLSSGLYIYRIEVTGKGNIPVYSEMKKTILLK